MNRSRLAVLLPGWCLLLGALHAGCGVGDPDAYEEQGAAASHAQALTTAKPSRTELIDNMVDVALSGDPSSGFGTFACSLSSRGEVWCWGSGDLGVLGRGAAYPNGLGRRAGPVIAPGVTTACGSYGEAADIPCSSRLTGARQISVGRWHACALGGDGKVYCWGQNNRGQLGIDPAVAASSSVPRTVLLTDGGELTDVSYVSAGDDTTCAVRGEDGGTGVYCWGNSGDGQAGVLANSVPAATRVHEGALTDVSEVSAGSTVCALQGGRVYCWGDSARGSAGNGFFQPPTAAVPLSESACQNWVCDNLISPTTECFRAAFGRYPVTSAYGLRPVQRGASACDPSGFSSPGSKWFVNVRPVYTGNGSHLCDVRTMPTAACNVTTAQVTTFARLVPSSGSTTKCAITTAGEMLCWGIATSNYGQTGRALDLTITTNPFSTGELSMDKMAGGAPVGFASGVSAEAAFMGNITGCAVRVGSMGERTAECWGRGYNGQLGRRSPPAVRSRCAYHGGAGPDTTRDCADTGIPIEVLDGAGVKRVAISENLGCAVLSTGKVACWGNASFTGNPSATSGVPEAFHVVRSIEPATQVAMGAAHTCALYGSGVVKCWGLNHEGQLGDGTTVQRLSPTQVVGLTDAVAVTAGTVHTCAVRRSGAVICWGDNYYGQLGTGTTTDSYTPRAVRGIVGAATRIVSGQLHTCVQLSGGISCWGNNSNGQLGDGTMIRRLTAVAVTGVSTAVAGLTAGLGHTCAIDQGTMKCWGNNYYGGLGDGTTIASSTPVAVMGLASAPAQAFGGGWFSCATSAMGTAQCWGENNLGQLGDGTQSNSFMPVAVSGLTGATTLSLSRYHACALVSGGVRCWGNNYEGACGDGLLGVKTTPVAVSGLSSGVSAIATGGGMFAYAGYGRSTEQSCALLATGELRCWGDNAYGQLGDGTTSDRPVPVAVIGL